MLILISPAKTLDFSTSDLRDYSEPEMLKYSKELINELKNKSKEELQQLMSISESLAELNVERYQNFSTPFSPSNAKQALLAFKGDVYQHIDVENFDKEDFEFAQKHLRILSGLYGLLKPLDLIQPYRLEMGTRLQNKKGKDLYQYWGSRISEKINEANTGEVIVNLASQEYFKAVDQSAIKGRVVTINFKEYKDGDYKIIGLMAKRARGMMTDFIIRNRITDIEQLKTFHEAGYEYSEPKSSENEWIFIRN
ncbi:peroxide stress protein YaaA [Penaeicola halotolerans]|uniref:peroxide stress protein YaaA n=1 Tax=Penaeicola halotolerans TaxID=2793196 RepID=UPI001CF890A9|nr:peroxide stress protein YaaA [Penaeicola halotolerans]